MVPGWILLANLLHRPHEWAFDLGVRHKPHDGGKLLSDKRDPIFGIQDKHRNATEFALLVCANRQKSGTVVVDFQQDQYLFPDEFKLDFEHGSD